VLCSLSFALLLSCARSFSLPSRRAVLSGGLALATSSTAARADEKPQFKRLSPIQFIAALGDPSATSGTGADRWGLWREDPGPRGVWLPSIGRSPNYKKLPSDGKAPAGWLFDSASWWVEEHGLIMETPDGLPAQKLERDGEKMRVAAHERRYVVTGDRQVTSVLTVSDDGRWSLSKGTLYDVTHLPCRSAVYTPSSAGGSCSPSAAEASLFPVKPGRAMPPIAGCAKEDWAVLFVVGVEA